MNIHDKYSTSFCINILQKGTCSYGEKCRFAHSFEKLNAVAVGCLFKTITCENGKDCRYKTNCSFLHPDEVVTREGNKIGNKIFVKTKDVLNELQVVKIGVVSRLSPKVKAKKLT